MINKYQKEKYYTEKKKYESDECCSISKLIMNYGEKEKK